MQNGFYFNLKTFLVVISFKKNIKTHLALFLDDGVTYELRPEDLLRPPISS